MPPRGQPPPTFWGYHLQGVSVELISSRPTSTLDEIGSRSASAGAYPPCAVAAAIEGSPTPNTRKNQDHHRRCPLTSTMFSFWPRPLANQSATILPTLYRPWSRCSSSDSWGRCRSELVPGGFCRKHKLGRMGFITCRRRYTDIPPTLSIPCSAARCHQPSAGIAWFILQPDLSHRELIRQSTQWPP